MDKYAIRSSGRLSSPATFLDGVSEPSPFCAAHPDRCVRLAQIAHLGGDALKASRGRAYYRALGQAGFDAYCEKHHGGNRQAACAALTGMGRFR